jgi:hypothetical protein
MSNPNDTTISINTASSNGLSIIDLDETQLSQLQSEGGVESSNRTLPLTVGYRSHSYSVLTISIGLTPRQVYHGNLAPR